MTRLRAPGPVWRDMYRVWRRSAPPEEVSSAARRYGSVVLEHQAEVLRLGDGVGTQ